MKYQSFGWVIFGCFFLIILCYVSLTSVKLDFRKVNSKTLLGSSKRALTRKKSVVSEIINRRNFFNAQQNNKSTKYYLYSPWEKQRKETYKYNCSDYYHGDLQKVKALKEHLMREPYQQAGTDKVFQWSTNCLSYKKYYSIQTKYVTEEERNFPIAFSIRMHTSVEQAEHLLRNIYAPQNIYCIYIDKKSSAKIHKTMSQIASCFDNVFIASKLEDFYYTSSTHVGADKQCMRDALKVSTTWKYFINLVGEDFPTKTNLELVRMLKILNGSNGIHAEEANSGQVDDRTRFVYKIINGNNIKTKERRPPFDKTTQFVKGAEYGLFSRDFVKWSLHAKYPVNLFKYFQGGTYASDELYWGTINRHPDAPGGYRFHVPRFSKARIWVYGKYGKKDFYPCRGDVVRAICIFSISELVWLQQQPEPFANKFKIETDPIALDCLGQHIRYKQANGVAEDMSFMNYNPVVYDKTFYPTMPEESQ